mmetsp:Transcript_23209/g.37114  ORF Transcript_23209/g.37114 Transcript_23209/m.37114 type:complete len:91 (-) Transcript_23209:1146-1418(-)
MIQSKKQACNAPMPLIVQRIGPPETQRCTCYFSPLICVTGIWLEAELVLENAGELISVLVFLEAVVVALDSLSPRAKSVCLKLFSMSHQE